METVAVNFHDDTGEIFSEFKLQVGEKKIASKIYKLDLFNEVDATV